MSQLIKVFRWIIIGVLCVVIISYVVFGMRMMKSVNIFTALQDHHGVIRELLSKTDENKEVFSEVKRHLEAHHKSEEIALYDVLKTRRELRKEIMVTVEEHHFIDMALGELEKLPKSDERWSAGFEVVGEFVDHHLKEEENEIFPKARQYLDNEQMNELGRRFEKELNLFLWKYRNAS